VKLQSLRDIRTIFSQQVVARAHFSYFFKVIKTNNSMAKQMNAYFDVFGK